MGIDNNVSQPNATSNLRRRAEDRLQEQPVNKHTPQISEAPHRLIHELEVHKIELEMQNASLLESMDETTRAKEMYADLFDYAPIAYLTLDNCGIINAVNFHAATLLGYVRSELTGKYFVQFVALEYRQMFSDFLSKVYTTQDEEEGEVTLLVNGNHALYVQINAKTIASREECRITLIDITERKQHEKALLLTRFSIEHSSDGIFWITPDARIVDVNESACQTLGYKRDELLNLTIPNIDPTYNSEEYNKLFLNLRQHGTLTFVTKHSTKDGKLIPVEIVANHLQFGAAELSCAFVRNITERILMEEVLRESRTLYRNLVEDSSDLITRVDTEGRFTFVNHASWHVYRLAPEDCIGRLAFDTIHPDDREATIAAFQTWLQGGKKSFTHENRLIGFDGQGHYHMVWTIHAEFDENAKVTGFASTARDITDLRHAEEEKNKLLSQLHQSQKMEAIGQLAGGVAHDFNNKLMVILGNAELAKMEIENKDKALDYLQEIRRAAEHSRDITYRLLSFSRQQVILPQILDANHIITESFKSLSRLIGEHISIALDTADDLWSIKLDPVQLDQIIMNLAVNARDAMPDGGTFAIETQNVTMDKANCISSVDFIPGDYVRITFSDTGIGMDQETISHIFEPFFTTKGIGKGTGLGLATIYGIASQNGGFIEVSSALGNGTSLKVYFPRHHMLATETEKSDGTVCIGSGSILLVEDEDAVRKVTAYYLNKIGYTVYEAESPHKALELAKDHLIQFDLVLTDVVMPDMNGVEMVKRIREIRPNFACIYISGYSAGHDLLNEMATFGSEYIQKPIEFIKLSGLLKKLIKRR